MSTEAFKLKKDPKATRKLSQNGPFDLDAVFYDIKYQHISQW